MGKTIIFQIKGFVELFMSASSWHGLNQVVAKNRHPIERLFWAIYVMLASFGAFWISKSTWDRFSNNPTVASLERNYNDWNTSFPGIFLCPSAKFDPNLVDLLSKKYNAPNKTEFATFVKAISSEFTLDSITSESNFDLNVSVPTEEYIKIVDSAKWKFKYNVTNSNIDMYNVYEMATAITEMGFCYSYNSAVAIYNNPKYWAEKNKSFVQGKVLVGNPFEGDIFAQIINMNTGYNSPSEFPDVSSTPMKTENNTYKTLDLSAISMYSTEATKSLTVAQRRCRFPQESDLALSPFYSYNFCRMECRMRLMESICGCAPHYYRPSENVKVCSLNGLNCIAKNKDYFIKLRDENGVKVDCKCLPQCDKEVYTTEFDNTHDWLISTIMKWSLTKYPRVRIKRDVLFGWADLLVAIGGTAGLFLSCSLLNLVEIFYFFTLRLFLFCLKNKQHN